jgi:hypothetical protein
MLEHLSKALALALLAGPWDVVALIERGRDVLGERAPWLRLLVRRLVRRYPAAPLDRDDELAAWLRDDRRFRAAVARGARVRHWLFPEAAMVPVPGPPAAFAIFPLPSCDVLAGHLELGDGELAWFADPAGINAATNLPPLLHYRYAWVPKARGGFRLLEAPKDRLKRIQRWILRHVLGPIPAAPEAHGFVGGRSVRSFVEPHAGHAVVVRLDLEDFFASVSRARVVALLRRVGYPRAVAAALAGLCTAATPRHVLEAHPRDGADLAQRFLTNARLRDPHLPQGAPTSPALANLAAWRLDRRLAALARGFGATMTRYADDLAFAGDQRFARNVRFFLPRAAAVALEEGFRVNHRKTRVMRSNRRQHLCGLVINERPNLPRRARDELRALLFNAARLGPESQNRDGHPDFRRHLEGRISWVRSVNPAAAARLALLFARIRWEPPPGGSEPF